MKLSKTLTSALFAPRKRGIEIDTRLAVLGALGLGAGAMYLLDPDRGAYRRSLVRDKGVYFFHHTLRLLGKAGRDFSHRGAGAIAELRGLFKHPQPTDDVLLQRIRAKLGRVVSHPHAVHVEVNQGCVTLRGVILKREVDDLLATIRKIEGVKEVDNRLEVHESRDNIPSLQGGVPRLGERPEILQEYWTPSLQVLMTAVGTGLAAYGLSRKDKPGAVITAVGGLTLLRAIGNRPLGHLLGLTRARRVIDIQKTITVHAPIEDVFRAWTDFEDFPRFMEHVKKVKRLGDRYYHWVISGPAGLPVSWDGEVTSWIPNQLIAWKSVPGSLIGNAGIVHFERNPDGSTRMHIQMTYRPPMGFIGHLVATLFGKNPKHILDDDMVRFKSLLEQGKTRAHGERVTREQIGLGPSTV